jgi:hypothetical protein
LEPLAIAVIRASCIYPEKAKLGRLPMRRSTSSPLRPAPGPADILDHEDNSMMQRFEVVAG